MSQFGFSELELPEKLQQALESIGYHTITPVQERVLPIALAGTDVIVRAETGSGKTVAFGLVALTKLSLKSFVPQTLVLCPTRELADQIAEVMRNLARSTGNVKVLVLTGGSSTRAQSVSLQKGAHVIVGTPGRVEDHLRRGSLDLARLNTFVLDEADRMLQMGFMESIDRIINQLPVNRQTLLLSATYPDEIESMAGRITDDATMISVENLHTDTGIEQSFYRVESALDRFRALQRLLLHHQPDSVLIFCNTRIAVAEVTTFLKDQGFEAIAMHGDLEQKDRDRNLIRFANRSVSIMVATDVAARGIDIEKLDAVVNYELSKDVEVHIHRSGRTGRAGESGQVWTLFDTSDKYRLEKLEITTGHKPDVRSLPARSVLDKRPQKPATVTIEIKAGKKQKLRPGDILGALTGDDGIEGSMVGKIRIQNARSFVAVDRSVVNSALDQIKKIKGRIFKSRVL